MAKNITIKPIYKSTVTTDDRHHVWTMLFFHVDGEKYAVAAYPTLQMAIDKAMGDKEERIELSEVCLWQSEIK